MKNINEKKIIQNIIDKTGNLSKYKMPHFLPQKKKILRYLYFVVGAVAHTQKFLVGSLYEKLKKNKSGQAVSKLEGRLCGVCRVELPVKELQDAKAGVRLVQCNSCRRIIYVS